MRQKLDIADVERRTKIRAKYLRALENEEWGTLPGPTFVKTFLRTYADLVGVDGHLLVEEYRTNHEVGEEFEPAPRAGRPAVARRQRRRPPPGPPSKAAVAVGIVVILVGFLLVLGLVSDDDEPDSQQAATDEARTETRPSRKPRTTPRAAPPPRPSGVTVRLTPAAPTYACIDTGAGTDLVFEGILEGARTFKHAKRLRLNLGKRAVDLRVNGRQVRIAPSPEPVGFDVTPGRTTEIPAGTRPCA